MLKDYELVGKIGVGEFWSCGDSCFRGYLEDGVLFISDICLDTGDVVADENGNQFIVTSFGGAWRAGAYYSVLTVDTIVKKANDKSNFMSPFAHLIKRDECCGLYSVVLAGESVVLSDDIGAEYFICTDCSVDVPVRASLVNYNDNEEDRYFGLTQMEFRAAA